MNQMYRLKVLCWMDEGYVYMRQFPPDYIKTIMKCAHQIGITYLVSLILNK